MLLIDKKISGNERGQQFYYNAFNIGLIILLLSTFCQSVRRRFSLDQKFQSLRKRESIFCNHVTGCYVPIFVKYQNPSHHI